MARRSPRPSVRFLPALVLLAAALAAAAYSVPAGVHPPLDRARQKVTAWAGKARETAQKAADALPSPPAAAELRYVLRVVDGDTVVLAGDERVRLIGVNTPESVDPRRTVQWYGKEAAAFTRSLLQGRRVRVEHDVERKDRYGRTLGYLWLEDGDFVNLRLVEEGYAFAYRYPPNVKYADLFREAERRAREGWRGLWSDRSKADALVPRTRR